jgi:hypothetical protein
MTPLTCQQVEAQIELYTAGACDAWTDSAIRQHLAHCPTCIQSDQEARQLIGLFDLRLQEAERLERLHARLARESQRRTERSQRWFPIGRPVAALVAMLLVTIGLAWSIRPGSFADLSSGEELAVALVPSVGQKEALEAPFRGIPVGAKPDALLGPAVTNAFTFALNLHGKAAKDFREQLPAAAGTGRLPLPPEVDLSLELHNMTRGELQVAPQASHTELWLDLTGPGVMHVAGPAGLDEPFLSATTVAVAPGQRCAVPIRRLVDGSRGALRYTYWTEPGDYTLTLRYRVAVRPAPRAAPPADVQGPSTGRFGYVIVHSRPIRIHVTAAPNANQE